MTDVATYALQGSLSAASFDAMLDRLEHAAQTPAQLIEETSHELRIPLSVLTTNADVLRHPDLRVRAV